MASDSQLPTGRRSRPVAPALMLGSDPNGDAPEITITDAAAEADDGARASSDPGPLVAPTLPPPPMPVVHRYASGTASRRGLSRAAALAGLAALLAAMGVLGVRFASAARESPAASPSAGTTVRPLPVLGVHPTEAYDPPATRAQGANATDLLRVASTRLERGDRRGAIEAAREAIGLDPSNAAPYVIWAQALGALGRRVEASAIYARCGAEATHGPVTQCRGPH